MVWNNTDVVAWKVHREKIKNVIIEDGVTNIGNYAFHFCQDLISVTIPDSVTSIGTSAFCQCKSLTSITIPDSVTNIGEAAFEGCKKLISVTIPDSVKSIGNRAFWECFALESITIKNPDCEIIDEEYTINNKAVIYGYAGSTAETYAENNSREFVPLSVIDLSCDVTGDGIVSVSDASLVLSAYTLINSGKDPELTEKQRDMADADKDGKITGSDATLILRYCTKLSSLLVGERVPSFNEWFESVKTE